MHLLDLQLGAEDNLAAAGMEELPEYHLEWVVPAADMAAGHRAQEELDRRRRAEVEGIAGWDIDPEAAESTDPAEAGCPGTDSLGIGRAAAAAQAERRSRDTEVVADKGAVREPESPPGAAGNTAGLLADPGAARRIRDTVRQVGRPAVVVRRSMAAGTCC